MTILADRLPDDPEILYLAVSCAWCGRMRRPCGEWIEVSPIIARSLSQPTDLVSLSHGVCPPCADREFGTR